MANRSDGDLNYRANNLIQEQTSVSTQRCLLPDSCKWPGTNKLYLFEALQFAHFPQALLHSSLAGGKEVPLRTSEWRQGSPPTASHLNKKQVFLFSQNTDLASFLYFPPTFENNYFQEKSVKQIFKNVLIQLHTYPKIVHSVHQLSLYVTTAQE